MQERFLKIDNLYLVYNPFGKSFVFDIPPRGVSKWEEPVKGTRYYVNTITITKYEGYWVDVEDKPLTYIGLPDYKIITSFNREFVFTSKRKAENQRKKNIKQ